MQDGLIDFIIKFLRKLLCSQPGPVATEFSLLYIKLDPPTFMEGIKMPQIKDTDPGLVAVLKAKTAEGNPAAVPAGLVWESSDPSVLIVTQAPDGASATITTPTPGPLGSAVMSIKKGDQVIKTEAFDVIAGDATVFELDLSPIQP